MNFIFLDCDGVLNDKNTKHTIRGFIGFDKRKIERLEKIIDATGAQIVLSSSWKHNWDKDKTKQDVYGDYLDERLYTRHIKILDKTIDPESSENRGKGILNWLEEYKLIHPGEEINFIILDDEGFDFAECNIADRWVHTHFYAKAGGLREEHVKQAIELLGGTYVTGK